MPGGLDEEELRFLVPTIIMAGYYTSKNQLAMIMYLGLTFANVAAWIQWIAGKPCATLRASLTMTGSIPD